MKIKILTIGKPKLPYAKMGAETYLGRIRRFVKVEHAAMRQGGSEDESKRLLAASESTFRVAMDERGDLLGTDGWKKLFDGWEHSTETAVSFLIGGADGHNPALRKSSDRIIALCPMTMQHELALVVLLEQIYRVYTIKNNAPYHRE